MIPTVLLAQDTGVILGTGTPNPDPERSGPGVAVIANGTAYVVDAGAGIMRRAAAAATRHGIPGLEARAIGTVLLTHLHSDHTIGLADVIHTGWVLERAQPLRLFGPPGTVAMAEHLTEAYRADIENRTTGLQPHTKDGWQVAATDIGPGLVLRDSNVATSAFPVPHDGWRQSKRTLLEASERELRTKWLLPNYPSETIAPLAGKLTRLWRDHDGRRVPRPDVKETVLDLDRGGYTLGIIANTMPETEIPDWMEADGLTCYFKAVVLPSKIAIRKPHPEIYWEAARRVGVEPAKCAYVGDNPVRDVEGTQAAGFGMMILMMEPATLAKEPPTRIVKPDHTIHEIRELLDVFPPRK